MIPREETREEGKSARDLQFGGNRIEATEAREEAKKKRTELGRETIPSSTRLATSRRVVLHHHHHHHLFLAVSRFDDDAPR